MIHKYNQYLVRALAGACLLLLFTLSINDISQAQQNSTQSKQENQQNYNATLSIKPKSAENSVQIDYDKLNLDIPSDIQSDLPQMKAAVLKPKKQQKSKIDLSFLAPVFKWLFYGLATAMVLYILYSIFTSILLAHIPKSPKENHEEPAIIPSYRPDAKMAQVLLADADKLAAAGKYDEAVHLILYRSIQDFEKQRPREIKKSLTAREIANLSFLTEKAKNGFALIGRLVENSFFGNAKLSEDDYKRSKQAYQEFAFEKASS